MPRQDLFRSRDRFRNGASFCRTEGSKAFTKALGDVNEDCRINLLDIEPFVDLLSNDGYSVQADVNQDGVLNLLDVSEFVSLLSE